MSKISKSALSMAVHNVIAFSQGEKIQSFGKQGSVAREGKKRKFLETIELQCTLKGYNPAKDKRINGSFVLPSNVRSNTKVCVLANAMHVGVCQEENIPFKSEADLKKFNKNKKQVKKLAKQFHAFLASDTLIKLIPRLLGPWLNRAGKFPGRLETDDDIAEKVQEIQKTIKFQMKKVLCMNAPIGTVDMSEEDVVRNVNLSVNFLVSLCKKGWQNVKCIYVKSTMGPAQSIYG
jgi:large subunit ribosomal protein L10Ae|tara:strand:+ start:586 stop:1287 length:702 start_codon:yes stop_codon:yes gene_type:complete